MNLTSNDFLALGPLCILFIGALLTLLAESFLKKSYPFLLCLATFIMALFASFDTPQIENSLLTPWIKMDFLTHFLTPFFLLIGISTALLASSFFEKFEVPSSEFYFLLLTTVFGLILIGMSADFLTFFIGLETLSIALYILCCYMKTWEISHESALKYFLIGSVSTAFLLYGIAFIYGALGTTSFNALLDGYNALGNKNLFLAGIAFITLGLAFKAAIVPFHVWAPDVYEGASNPVTAFMSVGTKVGAFAAFARIFLEALPNFNPLWNELIACLAYATLIFANFVAMRQTQMRRFFAYSGISHAGFLLLPLIASTPDSLSALLFYLVVYAVATLGAFAILAFLDNSIEGVMLKDLTGLFTKAPALATLLTLCLLTLAGIPPTVGFFAKFYLFKVAFEAHYYGVVILGLLTSILAAYYYLRIIATMLTPDENAPKPFYTLPAMVLGVVTFVLIIFLSLYPSPFIV